jgi:DNA-binding response OmpR family regulator
MKKRRRKDDSWDGTERRSAAVVLIVNDDPDACEMLVRMIGARGFHAVGATTSDDATGRLVSDLPRCVVLDLETGGIGTSLNVLDLIRSNDDKRISGARVVLCASNAKNRSFCYQSGTDSFVLRPFHIDELVAQIQEVLGRPDKDRSRHRRDELARLGG